MATATIVKRLTADEFFDMVHRPENCGRRFELERGEVIEMPPPGVRHGVVCGNIGWLLSGFVRSRNRGYVCTNDAGVVLETDPDTVRGIDVSLYDQSVSYDEVETGYARHLPTLAVEVLSPDDRPGRMVKRVSQFLRRGVSLVWLVDPEDCEVTVYRRGCEPYVLGQEDEITGEDVLPDLRCRVADMFRMPGESVEEKLERE